MRPLLTSAVSVLVLLGLALGPDPDALRNAAVGAVWLATFFSGVLEFSRLRFSTNQTQILPTAAFVAALPSTSPFRSTG